MRIERQICMNLPSYQLHTGQKTKFPLPVIEQSDLDNIRPFCDGFCHSGKIGRLPEILTAGVLSCSKRHDGKQQQRDRNTDKPNNAGVYFRFVRHSKNYSRLDKCIIDALFGVGSDAGAVYFMGLDYAISREITTTSSTDAKYGFHDAAGAANVLKYAAEYAYQHKGNNAEIAFFWEVELSAISAIYCMNDRLTDQIRVSLSEHNFIPACSFSQNLTGADSGGHQLPWIKYVNQALLPPNPARRSIPSSSCRLFQLKPYPAVTCQSLPPLKTTHRTPAAAAARQTTKTKPMPVRPKLPLIKK